MIIILHVGVVGSNWVQAAGGQCGHRFALRPTVLHWEQ